MKNVLKITAVLLTLITVLSFAACGGGGGGETTAEGVWVGAKGVDYGDGDIVEYKYTLTIGADGNGVLTQEWERNGSKVAYSYDVTENNGSFRIKAKELMRNGKKVDLDEEHLVEYTVAWGITDGVMELGEAKDYNEADFDLSEEFPVKLKK